LAGAAMPDASAGSAIAYAFSSIRFTTGMVKAPS
jgi:hypothetical protein